jgi:hypothetical protein
VQALLLRAEDVEKGIDALEPRLRVDRELRVNRLEQLAEPGLGDDERVGVAKKDRLAHPEAAADKRFDRTTPGWPGFHGSTYSSTATIRMAYSVGSPPSTSSFTR